MLVAHGMGRQTKFETLDILVNGLMRVARFGRLGAPQARLVSLDGERLHRLELTVQTDGGVRELHLYEAYWAPFTEGQVRLRDVMYLVFLAIWNGVQNGVTDFRRWLFGRSNPFPPQIRTVVYLLVGLAAVLSVVVINASIGLVAAARWGLGVGLTVVGDGLYGDLSTAFNFLFVCVFTFGFVLRVCWLLRRAPLFLKTLVGVGSVVLFLVVLAVTIAVGVAIPLFAFLHRQAGPVDDVRLLAAAFGLARVEQFNRCVELGIIALVPAALLPTAFTLVGRVWAAWRSELGSGERRKYLTTWVLLFVFGLVGGLALETAWLGLTDWGLGVGGKVEVGRGAVWVFLVIASLVARWVIVQYVGDVVAYVQPHVLDRFDTLRERIKEEVYAKARAIYGAAGKNGGLEYEGVAIVGHSLGSVIAYDALNRLINDDEVARSAGTWPLLRVVPRTFLFLTIASPLDKTAFVFGSQRRQSQTRHALAATAQPLIQRLEFRPAKWVNIYSPWDPISAPLKYYDPPLQPGRLPDARAVQNQKEPEATTLFLAHIEYWEGALIFETLLEELPSTKTHASRGSDETSCPHPRQPAACGITGLEKI
ncbi:MAG: hypothetical protein AUH99_00700 [Candidatus Rokubacteria bacterium 13_2_20CM_2_70_11]|nr:MAG: hypothetical protein AUH99_00700 [Candidatus Rokubacteria bacterium 13_2_20CM_2_70_11]